MVVRRLSGKNMGAGWTVGREYKAFCWYQLKMLRGDMELISG